MKTGLDNKYHITKANGEPIDPEADYFVLRLDTDPAARIAALAYADATDNQQLASDLRDGVARYVPAVPPPDSPRLIPVGVTLPQLTIRALKEMNDRLLVTIRELRAQVISLTNRFANLQVDYNIEHKQREALRALWDEEHAKRLELEAELADWRDTQRSIMAERCGDEQHCTCVPVLRREVERLREALDDVIESWSVHNAAVVAARALGRENVLELAEGKARSADQIAAQRDEIRRLRDLLQASLDLQAAEQATSDELKRQMEMLAINYTACENRLRAALERYADRQNWRHDEGAWVWLAPGEGPEQADFALAWQASTD